MDQKAGNESTPSDAVRKTLVRTHLAEQLANTIAVALRADRFYHRVVQLDVLLNLVSIKSI